MKHSENINEIAAAMAKAQGEMGHASKDSNNPHFNSPYADLASVWDTIRAPLAKNGISVWQSAETTEEMMVVIETKFVHTSGQWFSSELALMPRDKSPQAVGSATTYGRRYSLMAMAGIAPAEDDDGNAAQPPKHEAKKPIPNPFPKKATIMDKKPAPQPDIPEQKAPEKPKGELNESHLAALKKLMEIHKWEAPHLTEHIQARFGAERLGMLTGEQFQKLCETVKSMNAAMAAKWLMENPTEGMFK